MKKYNIVTKVFLLTIFFFMCSILINALNRNVISKETTASTSNTELRKRIAIDYSQKYPFKDDPMYEPNTSEETKIFSLGYVEKINNLIKKIESYSTDKMPYRITIVGINSRINDFVGMNFVAGDDTMLELKDNYFISVAEEIDVTEHSRQVNNIKNYCDEKGIPMLYVAAPYKTDKYDKQYEFMQDNINDNGDRLVEDLQEYGVDVLDLRDAIHDEKFDLYSMFYGTDHHWKAETGLWASEVIANEVNKRYGINLDIEVFQRNYASDLYANRFLGSFGKKVTLEVAELEDFSLVYPDWETDLSIEVPAYDYSAKGRFEDVIIDWMWLQKTEDIDYYNEYIYESYCYGNNALINIKNNQATNGKKILLLSNSYGLVVTPFLALSAEETNQLHPGFFNGSVRNYIEETKPDIVIILYCPSSIAPITGDGNSSIFVFD